jgi:type IX secretion system PorP/SprF family membrane protein
VIPGRNHIVSYRVALVLTGLILWINTTDSSAQIDYRFSQFLQNPLPVNPAFAGIEDFVDVKLGFRKQWSGFNDSPTHAFIATNMAFKISENNDFKHRGVRLFEAEAYNELEKDDDFGYRKGNRHGAAFYVLQNSDGGFQNLAAFVNYAYHLRITNQLIWSVGAGVGYELNQFDPTGVTVLNPATDITYQNYLLGENRKSSVNLNLGTVIYHRQFYLGYSAINAVSYHLAGDNQNFNDQINQLKHTVVIGYNHKYKYGVLITPSLLINILPDRPTQFIGSLRVRWHDKLWGGFQYVYLGDLAASIGFYLTPNIGFNYAYSYPTTQLNRVTSGSHEIVLGFKLNNRNYSRAYVW